MELDELKKAWNNAGEKAGIENIDIPDMIRNKSYGPVAELIRIFRKRLILLPFVLFWLIWNLSRHHHIFSDVLFWMYIAVFLALITYFYINYRILKRMQSMDGQVKENLEHQVRFIEKGVYIRLMAIRALVVVFIVVFELLLYFKQEPSLVNWYARPVGLRLAVYILFFILFYFFSKLMIKHK